MSACCHACFIHILQSVGLGCKSMLHILVHVPYIFSSRLKYMYSKVYPTLRIIVMP